MDKHPHAEVMTGLVIVQAFVIRVLKAKGLLSDPEVEAVFGMARSAAAATGMAGATRAVDVVIAFAERPSEGA